MELRHSAELKKSIRNRFSHEDIMAIVFYISALYDEHMEDLLNATSLEEVYRFQGKAQALSYIINSLKFLHSMPSKPKEDI